jgi:hypothetical protein
MAEGITEVNESIPPQNEVSGGPRTPLELGATGWKNTLKRTGKKFHSGAASSGSTWPAWRSCSAPS